MICALQMLTDRLGINHLNVFFFSKTETHGLLDKFSNLAKKKFLKVLKSSSMSWL